MTLHLEAPNTHALLDPNWARASAQKHYRQQLDLYTNTIRYAADLALRVLSSAPDGIPHHLVISVLFRQVIAAADATGELLVAAAVDQAHLQMRALVEARWGLIYAFRDPDKWGRHIYVSSLRQQVSRGRRWIPGTNEFQAAEYERQLRDKYGGDEAPRVDHAALQGSIDAIHSILARPEYSAINTGFDEFLKLKNFEGPWYFDGSQAAKDRITSIRKLAAAVGARDEYDSVYGYASDHVHGGYTGTHLALDDMGAYIAPIRTPEGIRQSLIMSFALLSDCCRRALEQWRPDEAPRFIQKYVDEWRGLLQTCPDVKLERNRAVNR